MKHEKQQYITSKHITHNGVKLDSLLDSANPMTGKTLVCCGDSITWGADMENDEGGFTDIPNIDCYWWVGTSSTGGSFVKQSVNVRMSYGYQIASRNGMTYYNAGVSGSTMQGLPDKNGFSLANGRYTKLPEHIDYLTIWFGWNDNAYGSLGTIDDTTNESYYGGYNVVLPYLINKYPDAKICLCVPFGATAGHREAIRKLANNGALLVGITTFAVLPFIMARKRPLVLMIPLLPLIARNSKQTERIRTTKDISRLLICLANSCVVFDGS